MFDILRKGPPPLLIVRVNGTELCHVLEKDIPCEKTPSHFLGSNSTLQLVAPNGPAHVHDLGADSGWFHFSIRVHTNLGCQADCVITQAEHFDPSALAEGKASGIRFQPFFLPGATVHNSELSGKGLFDRGLHFSGTVTSGNVLLSCECEHCKRSFRIRSYHSGFSSSGYFYSDSASTLLRLATTSLAVPLPCRTLRPTSSPRRKQNYPLPQMARPTDT